MKWVLAVDPGPVTSGVVWYDPENRSVMYANKAMDNTLLVGQVRVAQGCHVVVEWLTNMGQNVGQSVLLTARFVGRLEQARRESEMPFHTVTRVAVKKHLCPGVRAVKDKDVRAAVIPLLAPGAKLASHAWQAAGVAITFVDQHKELFQ